MATYPERIAEVEALETAGLGLVAVTFPDKDITLVKAPGYSQPGAAAEPVIVWREYAGGAARVAYGV